MIEAVIFDLDGTLIDLPINYQKLFREFSEIMKINDIHPITETIASLNVKTRKKAFDAWEKAELAALRDKAINNEGITLYNKYSEKPKALVTMQGRKLVRRILKSLELSFNVTATREDSLDRVEQLKMVSQRLGANPENVLFIGNTEGDLHAAQKVKCQFLRVGK